MADRLIAGGPSAIPLKASPVIFYADLPFESQRNLSCRTRGKSATASSLPLLEPPSK